MVNSFFHRLFPSHCLLCGRIARFAQDCLCLSCWADLPRILQSCSRCGIPMPQAGLCGLCQKQPPLYLRCISPLLYRAPISQLVAHFKYSGKLAYGRLLTAELVRCLRTQPQLDVDFMMPVPLHWRRRWTRGFNQAEIIADELSRSLKIPSQTRWLQRVRPTPPQQSLSAIERRKNLRAAFALRKNVRGARIALVDDVVTTGATVGEISRLLLDAGADSVQVWCLARTP